MSDSVPRLNLQRVVFHIADDMEWIKLKSSDFLTKPDVTIPMVGFMEKQGEIWLNDSDSQNDDAAKLALEEFDVTKAVQDAFVNCHETKSKKAWKDKGLSGLLKKAWHSFPASEL